MSNCCSLKPISSGPDLFAALSIIFADPGGLAVMTHTHSCWCLEPSNVRNRTHFGLLLSELFKSLCKIQYNNFPRVSLPLCSFLSCQVFPVFALSSRCCPTTSDVWAIFFPAVSVKPCWWRQTSHNNKSGQVPKERGSMSLHADLIHICLGCMYSTFFPTKEQFFPPGCQEAELSIKLTLTSLEKEMH